MPRRHPKRFAERPRDPRSRAVIAAIPAAGGVDLKLECGHVAHRKRGLCIPTRAICGDCPPAGGLGGKLFPSRPQGE